MSDYTLKTTVYKSQKPVRFRATGKPHYKMKLQITSVKDPTLQHLSRVDYVLHPTFKQRIRTSTNPSNGFAIDLRAWGTFDVTLKLYDTNEKVTTKVQSMKNGLEWR